MAAEKAMPGYPEYSTGVLCPDCRKRACAPGKSRCAACEREARTGRTHIEELKEQRERIEARKRAILEQLDNHAPAGPRETQEASAETMRAIARDGEGKPSPSEPEGEMKDKETDNLCPACDGSGEVPAPGYYGSTICPLCNTHGRPWASLRIEPFLHDRGIKPVLQVTEKEIERLVHKIGALSAITAFQATGLDGRLALAKTAWDKAFKQETEEAQRECLLDSAACLVLALSLDWEEED